ncbi:MAG TPA: DUF309 domain-containing protein [Bacteroidota bacterium]
MDERFYSGLEEFNKERFFEAHEVLEDLWHEERDVDRTFIQGIIQIAAAFYHLQTHNLKGAVSQFTKGNEKLTHFLPTYKEVSVVKLLDDVRENLRQIQAADPNFETIRYPKISYTRVATISNQVHKKEN